jgi:hypothetical protein
MVVVGPIGDATGAAAVAKLGKLQQNFSSRMYCPVDHYVAGEEKSLILKATDFCLVPSRWVEHMSLYCSRAYGIALGFSSLW